MRSQIDWYSVIHFEAVIVTFGTGRSAVRLDSVETGQISTMNRIFGTSSSSKKPKPTLQDVIDQVGVGFPGEAGIHLGIYRRIY